MKPVTQGQYMVRRWGGQGYSKTDEGVEEENPDVGFWPYRSQKRNSIMVSCLVILWQQVERKYA